MYTTSKLGQIFARSLRVWHSLNDDCARWCPVRNIHAGCSYHFCHSISHGHGHVHGIFILATHQRVLQEYEQPIPTLLHPASICFVSGGLFLSSLGPSLKLARNTYQDCLVFSLLPTITSSFAKELYNLVT
jgi:hypothetical protein